MKGDKYFCLREKQILLVERWILVFQEWGAGWGIHPAELVELIVMYIEAKDLLEAIKDGGEEEALDEVCKKMARLTRQMKEVGKVKREE
jgi:hypothetical protein